MQQGFSLVELMIIAAIIGILAAIVFPHFQSYTTQAKEATAKDNLRILRSVIELYAARHPDVPAGYTNDNPDTEPSSENFLQQTLQGQYLQKMPKNPFNGLNTIKIIGNSQTFPDKATGKYGWIYQPATKTIRLDRHGTTKDGISYYQYGAP
jgi:prepilin-type N-terminal cleavage/methylation domain-containing protein